MAGLSRYLQRTVCLGVTRIGGQHVLAEPPFMDGLIVDVGVRLGKEHDKALLQVQFLGRLT